MRQRSSSRVERLPVCLLLSVLLACDGVITNHTERDWQERFRASLVPGYTDFRGLEISADIGVAIFQYRLPEGINGSDAIATIARQLEASTCARVVRRDALQAQLRCANPNPGTPNGFEEYRAVLNQQARTVVVMYGDFDSESEISRYPGIEAIFNERVRR